jgi:hypothetical protein
MNLNFKIEEAESCLHSDSEEENEEEEEERKKYSEEISPGYIVSCLGKGVLNIARRQKE